MNRPLVMVGGGGHARVLIDALRQSNAVAIVGIVDPSLPAGSSVASGIVVLGGDEALERFQPADVLLVNAIGSVGSMRNRDAVYRRLSSAGFRFAPVVHPSAVISPSADLAGDIQAMAGCIVQCGASIGCNSIVNTKASVDHDCRLGETVHIAPGVTLSGAVTVGSATHIGTGACVIQGISIGSDCVVAAGSIVVRNVPDGSRLISQKVSVNHD